jgi:hypothetical protein
MVEAMKMLRLKGSFGGSCCVQAKMVMIVSANHHRTEYMWQFALEESCLRSILFECGNLVLEVFSCLGPLLKRRPLPRHIHICTQTHFRYPALPCLSYTCTMSFFLRKLPDINIGLRLRDNIDFLLPFLTKPGHNKGRCTSYSFEHRQESL